MPADILRTRLSGALQVVEDRQLLVYGNSDRDVMAEKRKNVTDFVELCERKERETGEPVVVIVSR